MMYVLVESDTGGVYAVKDDKSHERIVQIFSLKDDAERYHMMLDNIDFPRDLEVAEVQRKDVISNCRQHGYRYAIITPNDFVIPPPSVID